VSLFESQYQLKLFLRIIHPSTYHQE